VWVTGGQTHQTQGFEQVMTRAQRPRRAGWPRWPDQGAGAKGYSAARSRRWLQRRHIEHVIPTPKNQARQEDFDKATYRRRNIIERAVSWFKWCRALTFRFDKLAVNYVTLWIIANIQYLLRNYPEPLGIELSETTSCVRLTGSPTYASPAALPSRPQGGLPTCGAALGSGGSRTRWMADGSA
jgi:transposase